ncbi:uncharacterized protein LOC114076975 [Solanum pennellii]|uniref:Uncharacterized protein LOC114076975 n=1 Tax=Solanum pennellii TaxID=28526 RepID=A0ABM1VA16_SOLPN|nr:uncharacterized protein LOC114076975 [Solanum pennellii]
MKLRNEMEDYVKDLIISDHSTHRMMVEHVFQLGEKLKLQKENVYIAVQLVNKSLLAGPVRERICQSIGCLLIVMKLNEKEEQLKKYQLHFKYPELREKIALAAISVLVKIGFDIGRWVGSTPFFFLPYMLTKYANHFGIDEVKKEEIATSAENRILLSARDVSSIKRKPSIIAAGAILIEIDLNLTSEALKDLPMTEFLDPTELAESYALLQNVDLLLPNQEAVGDADVLKEIADLMGDESSTGTDQSTSKRRSEDSTDKSTSKRVKTDG